MIRIGIFVFSLSILLGCTPSPTTLPYDLTISTEGLGPIHPNEPFDARHIQTKLPGFDVESMAQITEQNERQILVLKRNDTILAYFTASDDQKRIEEITVISALISDKNKHSVGDRLPSSQQIECHENTCYYQDHPNLFYSCDRNIIREITVRKL